MRKEICIILQSTTVCILREFLYINKPVEFLKDEMAIKS